MPTLCDITPAIQRAAAERLADIFTILQRSFVLNLSKQLARGKVSFPQYLLLGFMTQERRSLSMTEIARRMKHTTAAATGLVDRLEKLTYARRTPSKEDRRKILVHITPKGANLVQRVREEMTGNVAKLMDFLDEEEQQAWVRIYDKILVAMESHGEGMNYSNVLNPKQ